MRITYRTLAKLVEFMDENQKDSDVTVEIPTEFAAECYSAELRLAGDKHDGGLEDGHPVIYVHCLTDDEQKRMEAEEAAKMIGL